MAQRPLDLSPGWRDTELFGWSPMEEVIPSRQPVGAMKGPRFVPDCSIQLMPWRASPVRVLGRDVPNVEVVSDTGEAFRELPMKGANFPALRVRGRSVEDHMQVSVPKLGRGFGKRGGTVEVDSGEVFPKDCAKPRHEGDTDWRDPLRDFRFFLDHGSGCNAGQTFIPIARFRRAAGLAGVESGEMKVGIVGVGITPFRPTTPEFSWKELTYDGAQRAYADAGIDPREDVDTFITCAEDYYEGFGIFDEFTPDQLGAVMRPMHTVGGDGIAGLANAFMIIQSGIADIAVVESHSKASDILTYEGIVAHGLDPIWNKPLGGHPNLIAGLEMDAYLRASGNTAKDCAAVVAKNRQAALHNPIAGHAARVTPEQAEGSPALWAPLRTLDVAPLADGCVVLVVAGEKAARKARTTPVWIRGIGWATETPSLETRDWTTSPATRIAASMAYDMAKVRNPAEAFDIAEIDDRFSYKELQHLEALGLARRGQAGKMVRRGDLAAGGKFPTNVSGGSLGCGNVLEACGLHRLAEAVLQLRGDAGSHQVDGARNAIVQSWRGLPAASCGVAILGVAK